ncbi:response regulator [Hymenobacter arizonensis]|uniref:Response regulator receiver domain-containing protein n=1 Tax=Hymenobacter arizonensis TaxID=1227077 RepID=A0A1I6AH55_HYMAR|nr:response regulator [Hymenobacter arizonensis]SFQ67981.1 Response regulator receiver domain-containing protein [Hymenobacter arizonensis]
MQSLSCVLLVDDDPTTNYLNQLLLKRLGFSSQVMVALNGQEALDLLLQNCHRVSNECPALILLDVKMPVMDGFAFLEAYDKLPLTQKESIVIVMLTTSLHPQDVERVERLDIASFLNKPLTEAKLNQVLESHFSG